MSFKLSLRCESCFQDIASGPCNATTVEYLTKLAAGAHEECTAPVFVPSTSPLPVGQLSAEERENLGLPPG